MTVSEIKFHFFTSMEMKDTKNEDFYTIFRNKCGISLVGAILVTAHLEK
ncbi:hypothetical protein M23134_03522 [Microscilla marina ATCC 23134]|uniref:Uncharacterized protein n=1 Tax=Microscilla marina ATCC 23134 TaxID=313606 RepID=A1ZN80_MICM2|nr:hypothetical protein M23134_03522 [Microscilla marina ATCC 23134]